MKTLLQVFSERKYVQGVLRHGAIPDEASDIGKTKRLRKILPTILKDASYIKISFDQEENMDFATVSIATEYTDDVRFVILLDQAHMLFTAFELASDDHYEQHEEVGDPDMINYHEDIMRNVTDGECLGDWIIDVKKAVFTIMGYCTILEYTTDEGVTRKHTSAWQ